MDLHLGTVHQGMAAFQNLKNKHAEFHQCAGDVVRKVNTGDVAGALNMVDKVDKGGASGFQAKQSVPSWP
jgi:hypothetical protein